MGRMLQGRRQDIVLATKFGTRVPKYTAIDVETSLTNSLQKLQTDYIDLYQARWYQTGITGITSIVSLFEKL